MEKVSFWCHQCRQIVDGALLADPLTREAVCPNCKQFWLHCPKCEKYAMMNDVCLHCGHDTARPLSLKDIQEGVFVVKVDSRETRVVRHVLGIQRVSFDHAHRGRGKYRCVYSEYLLPDATCRGQSDELVKNLVRWGHRLATLDEIKGLGF